jgi:ParB-like chromosome segregation protein Spo0J
MMRALLPLMNKEAFDSLVHSISESGQQEPISINDKGEVLDRPN